MAVRIYTSTDVNEIRTILEGRDLNPDEFVRDYNFGGCRISSYGREYYLLNIDPDIAKRVMDKEVRFKGRINPLSVILGANNSQDARLIMRELFDEGISTMEVKD